MVTWCIPCIYDPNLGLRTFSAHMPLTFVSGHMCCKRPKAKVLGSYIRGIHQVAMIHVIYMLIVWYKTPFFTEWCICDINYLSQLRAMAAISVYVCV